MPAGAGAILPSVYDTALTMTLEDGTLAVSGAIDEYSFTEFRRRVQEAADAHPALVVDLTAVEYLPSAGIGILAKAGATAREQGRELRLVAAEGSHAERVLAATGIPHDHA